MFRKIFLKRNLSINQVRINYFLFHPCIEFLIFYEFVRKFQQKKSNVDFSIKIPENLCA